MSKLIQARIVNYGFILAFVILSLVGALALYQARQLARANALLSHTHQVIESVNLLLGDIKNAEGQERSYLLFGSPAYLAQYQQAAQHVRQEFAQVEQLTQENDDQEQRLKKLAPLLDTRMGILQKSIEARQRQGVAVAVQYLNALPGQFFMRQIEQQTAAIGQTERNLLAHRNVAALETAHHANTVMLAGFVLSIAALGWGFLTFGQQNGARLRAEEARREMESRYGLLIDNVRDHAVLMLDADGHVISWNEGAEQIKGYSEEEILGAHFSIFYQAYAIRDGKPALALQSAAKQGAFHEEGWRVRKDSSLYWADITINAIRGPSGELEGYAMVSRDVTGRKRADDALKASQEQLQSVMDNVADGIVVINALSIIETFNPAAAQMFGYRPEAVIGRPLSVLMPAEFRASYRDAAAQYLAMAPLDGENAGPREMQGQRCNGEVFPIEAAISEMRVDGRRLFIGIIRDVTERKRAEQAMLESESKFRATFEHAPVGIVETALDGRLQQVNYTMCEMLGYAPGEMTGLSAMDITLPADQEITRDRMARLLSGEISDYTAEKRYVRKDGSFIWASVSASLRRDAHTQAPLYLISVIENITERKQAEEALLQAHEQAFYLASHDNLTGLANRAQFRDRLKDALAYARRDGHMVALHMLDLDRFKYINDTHGHQAGDLLLKTVARRITSTIRETDIAARLGGDEFVIIQTHLADRKAASQLAEKLVHALGQPYTLDGQEVLTGASVGVALYPKDAVDLDQLIKKADMAVYAAKNRGRGNYQRFTRDLGMAYELGQQLEKDLNRALDEQAFRLCYQPQYDLATGRVAGVEALLRWQNQAQELVPAADFIEAAEEAGLTLPIGEWALREACQQHRVWLSRGLDVPLGVNISAKQLQHPRFPDMVRAILGDSGLPADRLQLEIREPILLDSAAAADTVAALKAIGVRLALDDFGTELTALSCLHDYPLDMLKLGAPCIQDLPGNAVTAATVSAILGLAQQLDIQVCASGVETQEQLTYLKAHGCPIAQGFYLSAPGRPEVISRLAADATA